MGVKPTNLFKSTREPLIRTLCKMAKLSVIRAPTLTGDPYHFSLPDMTVGRLAAVHPL